MKSDSDERSLARKLARRWHLNVPERNSLPANGIAASAFVGAIQEILDESGRYPGDWSPDEPSYDGVVITAAENGFKLHTRHEIGVGQFSSSAITKVPSLEQAVRAFLQHVFNVDDLDGVPIDWSR